MAKKMSRLDELWDAEIDYSIPIDRFAKKAKALLNKLAKEMKDPIRSDGAVYNDGGARIYVTHGVSASFLAAFDKAVRELAEDYKPLTPLKIPVVSVEVGGFEILVNFC